MDVAYNQHSDRARRKNRSSTNLNHLTLAPLTVKLPIDDDTIITEQVTSVVQSYTYLQGKSAPTTPRLLSRSPVDARSRSPARSHHRRTPSAPSGPLPKSKSSTHINGNPRHSVSGATTPRRRKDDALHPKDRNDSDWLLRTGAVMTSEAREYKGQAWLVSRQSSTSLAGLHDPEEEAFEQELAREREVASRRTSRRGSSAIAAADDEASPYQSRLPSRPNSRSHSRAGIRSQVLTPLDRPGDDSYFASHHEAIDGPDFVNLDEKLEELERDTSQDDEAAVRRLVRRGQSGKGTWVGGVIGWSLFSVDEDDENSSDDEDDSQEGSSQAGRGAWTPRHFEGVSNVPEERIPPPTRDEGKWKDAAWLLSVAAKVMF